MLLFSPFQACVSFPYYMLARICAIQLISMRLEGNMRSAFPIPHRNPLSIFESFRLLHNARIEYSANRHQHNRHTEQDGEIDDQTTIICRVRQHQCT